MSTDRVYKNKNGLGWHEWIDMDGTLCIELTGEGFLTDAETEKLKAEFLTEASFELLVDRDCRVYMPAAEDLFAMFEEPKPLDERLFLIFKKGAISPELAEAGWRGLKGAARPSKNRGVAGGKVDPTKFGRDVERVIPVGDGTRARYVTRDGVVSDTVEANVTMGGIAGFYPPSARNPYTRMTSYTRDNWETFKGSWEFLQRCAELFAAEYPARFESQTAYIEKHNLAENGWTVCGTPYSTITVNKNFQTAVHQDAGDYKAGLENFSVYEAGPHQYKGGYTVFPQYRIAFNCRTGDWVGMDVAHNWHGNTPIEPLVEGEEDFERYSFVMYLRADLAGSGTQAEEAEKYEKWRATSRNPVEQHEYRVNKIQSEKEAAEEFVKAISE